MNAIDFHDGIAAEFDERYESSVAFRERFQVWTTLFQKYVKPGDRVIDLGCGSGVFSSYLASQGCKVIGIDGSAEMVLLAKQKQTSAYVQYFVQSLPLANTVNFEPQDIIIASSLLEYVDDMTKMLQQVYSLLKDDGLLLVSIPNKRSIYRKIERFVFSLTGYPRYVAHVRNVSTEAQFNCQLRASGFDVLETIHFSSHDPLSTWLKWCLPKRYVNNLFVGVYRKTREIST